MFAIGDYAHAPSGETADQAKARRDGRRFTLAEARDERTKAQPAGWMPSMTLEKPPWPR